MNEKAFLTLLDRAARGEELDEELQAAAQALRAAGVSPERLNELIHNRDLRTPDLYKPRPAPMRTNLKVSFADKDQVKRLGARWSPNQKVWYVEIGTDLNRFEKWL